MCECKADYCLHGAVTCSAENYNVETGRCDVSNNDATKDISCQFTCACKQACDVNGTATTAAENCKKIKDGNKEYDDCPICTRDSDCSLDEDCIKQDDTKSFCVGSGLCTDAKHSMCDLAYTAVTGSPNNRAKCCPDTSGCIKTRIGVIHTSTCGNSCGTSCLGDEKNPGNYGHSPSTFCSFGSRLGMCQFHPESLPQCLQIFFTSSSNAIHAFSFLSSVLLTTPPILEENMPYCPTISQGDRGQYSCTNGGNDSQGDNSICCWQNSTQPWRNEADATARDNLDVSVNGKFNCDPTGESTVGHGNVTMDNQYALGWTVDGHTGRDGVTISPPDQAMCIDSEDSYSSLDRRNEHSIEACSF